LWRFGVLGMISLDREVELKVSGFEDDCGVSQELRGSEV
jgi:hypothetical protein